MKIGYISTVCFGIPREWVVKAQDKDIILTPSQFCKSAIVKSGVEEDKIKVVSPYVNFDHFAPEKDKLKIRNAQGIRFLAILDFSPFSNWEMLIESYFKAFRHKQNACLIIYNDGAMPNEEAIRGIQKIKKRVNGNARIFFFPQKLSEELMPNLFSSCDCFIDVSRNAFGIKLLQAMACGIPVIGPKVGGNREFMHHNNSCLVSCVSKEKITKRTLPNHMFQGLSWARLDPLDISAYLLGVYGNIDCEKDRAAQDLTELSSSFGYDNFVKSLSDAIG